MKGETMNKELLDAAIQALQVVADNWDEGDVIEYPSSLPSFNDLLFDLHQIKLVSRKEK